MTLLSATSPLPAIPQSGTAPLEQAQYVRDVAAFSRRLNAGDVTASLSDLVTAHRALATIAHGVADPERIEALLGIAQHHYVAGYALAGIEPAIDAMNAARAHGDPLWLMRALNTLGYCLSDTVDVAGAMEYFVEALELAIAHQSERAECSLWGGLGTALVYAGQHDEAFACFERAASKTGAPLTVRAAAYTNLALLCLYKSDLENGLEYARQAISAMPDPHAPNEMLNRVLAETYCARLLLADKPTQAAQRVAIAKELAAKSRSERAWHAASIAEGVCEVARGHVDVGLSRLNRLLEQARSMRTGLRDTLLALVSAFQSIGQPDRADQYVRELAHFSRSNRRDYFRSRLAALRIRAAATQSDPTPQAEAEPPGSAQLQILERLAVQANLHEDPTGMHGYRVGRLAALLATESGSGSELCAAIEVAGRLHDIGKLAPGPAVGALERAQGSLENEEPQAHAVFGADMLRHATLPNLAVAEDAARHHHECFDGTGHPAGLAGEAIPFAARVVAIANAFDTMVWPPRGRFPWAVDRALSQILAGRATRFDPHLVDLFIALIQRLRGEDAEWQQRLLATPSESPYLRSRARIDALLSQRPGMAAAPS